MTEAERLTLEEVRVEKDTATRVFRELLAARPKDRDLVLTAGRIELTYLLRVYAAFEGILRNRLGLSIGSAESLTNLVQRTAGEGTTYDPATNAMERWWQLFRRDRNPLMHGHGTPPAWSINITIAQMQVFLQQFP